MRPLQTPIGLLLAQTAKAVSRAFDDALTEAGGSLPTWLVLMSLMRDGPLGHGELAERVGGLGPTLTHHLDGLEQRGLVRREPPPATRGLRAASRWNIVVPASPPRIWSGCEPCWAASPPMSPHPSRRIRPMTADTLCQDWAPAGGQAQP